MRTARLRLVADHDVVTSGHFGRSVHQAAIVLVQRFAAVSMPAPAVILLAAGRLAKRPAGDGAVETCGPISGSVVSSLYQMKLPCGLGIKLSYLSRIGWNPPMIMRLPSKGMSFIAFMRGSSIIFFIP
jgi:hypothetical protein